MRLFDAALIVGTGAQVLNMYGETELPAFLATAGDIYRQQVHGRTPSLAETTHINYLSSPDQAQVDTDRP